MTDKFRIIELGIILGTIGIIVVLLIALMPIKESVPKTQCYGDYRGEIQDTRIATYTMIDPSTGQSKIMLRTERYFRPMNRDEYEQYCKTD